MAENVTIQTSQWGANSNSPYVSLNAYIEGKTDTTVTYHWWLSYSNPTQSDPGWNPVRVIAYVNGQSVFDQGVTIGTSAADGISNGTVTVPLQASAGTTGIGLEAYFGGTIWGGQAGTWQGIQGSVDKPAAGTPKAPSSASHVRNSDSRNTVSWQWDGSTPASAILVQRKSNGGSWESIAELSTSATSYVDTSTGIDRSYVYRVGARNASGTAWSGETTTTYNTPAAPMAISGARQAGTTIAFTVENASATATGAKVQYSSNGTTWTDYTTIDGLVESFTANLATAAYWRIANTRGSLVSGYAQTPSQVIVITPPNAPVITAPRELYIRRGRDVRVEWNYSSPDGSAQSWWRIYVRQNGGNVFTANSTETGRTATQTYCVIPGSALDLESGIVSVTVQVKGAHADYAESSTNFTVRKEPTSSTALTSNGHAITDGVIRYMPIGYSMTVTDDAQSKHSSATMTITDSSGAVAYSEQMTLLSENRGAVSLAGSIDSAEFMPRQGEIYTFTAAYTSNTGFSCSNVMPMHVEFVPPVDAFLSADVNVENGSVSIFVDNGEHEETNLFENHPTNNELTAVRRISADGYSTQGNLAAAIVPTIEQDGDKQYLVYSGIPYDYEHEGGRGYEVKFAAPMTGEYIFYKADGSQIVRSTFKRADNFYSLSTPWYAKSLTLRIENYDSMRDPLPYVGYYGATPSPSNPQPIISAGGKNLLDESATIAAHPNNTSNTLNSLSDGISYIVPCKPNTTYTLSRLTSGQTPRFVVASTAAVPTVGASCIIIMYYEATMKETFTTGADAHYLVIFLDRYSAQPKGTGYQLELGSAETSYVPYGMVEATVQTDNLWRYDGIATSTNYNVTCRNNGDGSYTLTGTNTYSGAVNFYTSKMTDAECLEDTSYSLSCDGQSDDVKAYVTYYNEAGNASQKLSDSVYVPISGYNASYRIGIQVKAGATVNVTIRPMLVKGTQKPSSFTPYAKSVSLVSLRSPEWLTNDSSRVKSAWDGVVGSAATMTAESLVGEPSAYQWQTTTDGTWTNSTTASAKTQNLSISVTLARISDKRYYRCEMTVNGKAVYTEPVLINYLGGFVHSIQSLTAHDELTVGSGKTVLTKRVYEADMGKLAWTKLSNGNVFQSTDISSLAKKGKAASELSDVMCDIYAAVTPSDAYAGRAVGICVNGNAGELWVSDTASYTDADAFKTAMAGVKLIYELAEPMEIELEQTDFQDVPTGTVTYEWGTVGESSMTTYDGKAEAVSVTVNRVTPDGTVCIADRVPLGTGMVDWYAPLNTDYSYQVVSNAESGAVSAVEHPQFIKTDRWFCYWDGGIAWAVWNPSGSVSISRPQKTRVYYDGRKYPVSYDGDAVECGVSQSFVTIDRARSRDIERLVEDGGRCVYKSADGRVFHADVDYQTSPAYTAKHHGGITLSINRIDGKEL